MNQMSKITEVDPITLQVIRGAFETIAEEMGHVLYRMSFSSIIRESQDLGAGLFDVDFNTLCESESTPMHIGSIPGYLRGIAETLDRLPIARCVASSSQMERIRLSLTITGLIGKLEPHLFSATMVRNGKPAPDLFLHAAQEMGTPPSACIVIEDSPAGIQAAKAAGMRVFAFAGASHARTQRHLAALTALEPDALFDDMRELLHLVARERGSEH